MKEQLVSFKVAKLAKEKGFNYAYEFYDKDGKLEEFGMVSGWCNSTDENYPAPTQSLLQKWLREEYGMNIYIEALLEKQTKKRIYSPVLVYFQEDLRVILRKNFSKSGFFYIVYEKALDDILEEALKLIDNESTKESI